ncbi:receptor-type tyrosine-protein phosphatase eta-like [Polypterus senegalus]|uniref:receptor-type tyrosine-protein phosphatase eta-like n=1 Tax=Polypterus senegalus TaxID=55291 RepID=UPI001965F82B|nr:receptor-type tyrosine-protein phosphatase eta-like [Polypterus senegalus]
MFIRHTSTVFCFILTQTLLVWSQTVISPKASNVTTASIFLCWVAPLGRTISYGVNISNSGQSKQLVTDNTYINVTNLDPATFYSFVIFAVAGDNVTAGDSATITAFTSE